MRHRRSAQLGALACTLLICVGCADDEEAISYDELVEACIRSTACGINAYPYVSQCVDSYYKLHRKHGFTTLYASIYHCVNNAKANCNAIFTCYGAKRGEAKCDTTYKASCQGTRARFCDLSNMLLTFDCGTVDLQCAVNKTYTSDAKCGLGSCSSGYKARCEDNRLIYCENGIVSIDDCGAQGLSCGTAGTVADCVGNSSDACDNNSYPSSCQGDVAHSCTKGRVRKEDCSERTYHTRCKDGDCVETHSQCSSGSLDRCSGEKLEACLDGKWQTFDCKALGFGACLPATNGASCAPTS